MPIHLSQPFFVTHAFGCVVVLPPVASAPTNLMAVQEGATSIRVSWIPPTPLGYTTGYRIYYRSDGFDVSGGSTDIDVSDGSTDNYLLTGLQNGNTYTIYTLATSEHFFNNFLQAVTVGLGRGLLAKKTNAISCVKLIAVAPGPGQPILTVVYTTATSISLSWSVPSGSVVDSYEVMWTSDECPDDILNSSSTITDTSHIIGGLRGGTSYSITVSATNSVGTAYSDSVTGETWERGKWP